MKHIGTALRVGVVTALTGLTIGTAAPAVVAGPSDRCAITTPTANSTLSYTRPVQSTEFWGGTQGSEFYLDGNRIGYSETGVDWQRHFVAPGEKTGGLSTSGYANGAHTLTCRDFGTWGRGALSTSVPVTFNNSVRILITSPTANRRVDATTGAPLVTLKATVSATGTTLPTSATFKVDGVPVATAPCSAGVCTATWNPINHASPWLDSNAKAGLRIITATAKGGNGVWAKSKPVLVHLNKSDAASSPLLSTFETEGRGRVARDGGWSVRIPGTSRALFAFGDGEYVWTTGPKQGTSQWVPHSTFASAPIAPGVPAPLTESPNASNHLAPEPVMSKIQQQVGLTDPQGGKCDYFLTWPTGMVKNPANNNLLVTFMSMCTEKPTGTTADYSRHQVEGIADVNPTTGAATLRNIFVAQSKGQLHPRQRLVSPVSDGTYLYFYSADSTGTYAVRVPAAQWATPSAYRWKTASGFTGTTPASATSIGAGSFDGGGAAIARYPSMTGSPYLKVTQPSWQTITVQKSSTPYGPWTSTKVTNLGVCKECRDANNGVGGWIYSAYGHPDFSNSTQMMLTFTDHAQYRVMAKMLTVL
ncbi:hypothetical protein [Knoellia subterranea]|uniref:Uncharacterized protein n=1 Tax=Knoellia subterranea KCTC 19937 TaxID=1385521 RepID=A0A0A0JLA1_9MICO|nr:hypothetical protein [Knoellia subterranea]KGN37898.1 hypothetical protein N803_12620 [Knoellia subterranea KCTC 19937]